MGRGTGQGTPTGESLVYRTGDAGRVYRRELRRIGFEDPYEVGIHSLDDGTFKVTVGRYERVSASFSGEPLVWLKGIADKDALYDALAERAKLQKAEEELAEFTSELARLALPFEAEIASGINGRPYVSIYCDENLPRPSGHADEVSDAALLTEFLKELPDGAGPDEYRVAIKFWDAGYQSGYSDGHTDGYRNS